MNRKIGGHVSTSGGILNAIKNTQLISGNCMQIFAGSPRSWARKEFNNNEADQFINEVGEFDLFPVYIHALYLINLTADNKSVLENSMKTLESELKNSVLIRSAGVILHIGSYTNRSFELVVDDLINRINQLLESVPKSTIILENSAGQNGKIGTLEELGYLIDKLKNPRIKICLDSAHLFADRYNLASLEGIELLKTDLNKYNLVSSLECLHLNDSGSVFKSHRDIHANLGKGNIGLEGLKSFVNIPVLRELPIILEVPGDNNSKIKGPDLVNINITKNLVL